ncbi:hypothetical protein AB0G00_19085 [Nocardia salmonicida]|uniref:DUF6630 family protein n=1 Tax=Nocardia salmonicida TaxID=53431 RepID=UPI0033C3C63F
MAVGDHPYTLRQNMFHRLPEVNLYTPDTTRFPPSLPGRSAEHALMSVAVTLAPDAQYAVSLVSRVWEAVWDSDDFKQRYPRHVDLSWSSLELAREIVLAALNNVFWDEGLYLELFDWRESADDIDEKLRSMPSRPAMSWDRSPAVEEGTDPYPSDSEVYLREVARQCREVGMALVRITKGDSYYLGFVPSDRSALLVDDATTAGYLLDVVAA